MKFKKMYKVHGKRVRAWKKLSDNNTRECMVVKNPHWFLYMRPNS